MFILIKCPFISLALFWLLSTPAYAQKENLVVAYSSIGATSIPVWIAEDFVDMHFVRELDESGFLDHLYE